LAYRPRDDSDYELYRKFLSSCRVGFNCASTGGIVGGKHVKHRCLEVAAAGALLLEERGSPLADWFVPGEDYLEYSGIEEVHERVNWAHANPAEAQAIAAQLREKVVLDHSPAVFWSQVMERLGLGAPLRVPREVPWKFWLMPQPGQPVRAHVNGNPPILLERHAHHNLVGYGGQIYIVPMMLGAIDLADPLNRGRAEIAVRNTLAEARLTLLAM
jgi:hypothetical protein